MGKGNGSADRLKEQVGWFEEGVSLGFSLFFVAKKSFMSIVAMSFGSLILALYLIQIRPTGQEREGDIGYIWSS
jgi:hypothetical protein